jgi:hypothetical protein
MHAGVMDYDDRSRGEPRVITDRDEPGMAGIEVDVAGHEGSAADLETLGHQAVDVQLAAQSLQCPEPYALDGVAPPRSSIAKKHVA